MKALSQIELKQSGIKENKGFVVETTFVLFFLAVEFGQSFRGLTLDGIFMAVTLLMLMILPYFLPFDSKSNFANWLLGRSLITGFAVLLGVIYRQSIGVVLPDAFRFLPMTLLIVTAMLSCYIQFYSFFKLRMAK